VRYDWCVPPKQIPVTLTFFLGLLVLRKVWNKEINFIGKASLLKPPIGWYLKWVGGAPIIVIKKPIPSRHQQIFFSKQKNSIQISLISEGTRQKSNRMEKLDFIILQKTARGFQCYGLAFRFRDISK